MNMFDDTNLYLAGHQLIMWWRWLWVWRLLTRWMCGRRWSQSGILKVWLTNVSIKTAETIIFIGYAAWEALANFWAKSIVIDMAVTHRRRPYLHAYVDDLKGKKCLWLWSAWRRKIAKIYIYNILYTFTKRNGVTYTRWMEQTYSINWYPNIYRYLYIYIQIYNNRLRQQTQCENEQKTEYGKRKIININ